MRGMVAVLLLAGCVACSTTPAVTPATIAPKPLRPGTSWVSEPFPQAEHDFAMIGTVSSGDGVTWAFGSWYDGAPAPHSQAFRRDPDGWHELPMPDIGNARRSAVVSRDDVWVMSAPTKCCRSTALHWDGHEWHERSPGATLADLTAFGPDQVWTVGARDTAMVVLRWDGSAWRDVPLPRAAAELSPVAVEGTGPDDLWAVATTKTYPTQVVTLHWDGHRWSRAEVPGTGGAHWDHVQVNDVAAVAPDDVWLMVTTTDADGMHPNTHRPTLLHWDGAKWREQRPPEPNEPTEDVRFLVVGGQVWMFGTNLFRHDGEHWHKVTSPPGLRPSTGTVLPDGRLLVACPAGKYRMNDTVMELWV